MRKYLDYKATDDYLLELSEVSLHKLDSLMKQTPEDADEAMQIALGMAEAQAEVVVLDYVRGWIQANGIMGDLTLPTLSRWPPRRGGSNATGNERKPAFDKSGKETGKYDY